jgi:hypothetical protein
VLTIVGIAVAPIFWIMAVGHASFTYRKEAAAHQAELMAAKLAEKLRDQNAKAPRA